jgi:hypothetical protein
MPKRPKKTTLKLPSWIRTFSHPRYVNVYKWLKSEPKLYHTETLLGDWNGETLLLSKDAYPAHVFLERFESGEVNPWSPRAPQERLGQVNRRVSDFAAMLKGTQLYGAALAHMLKMDRGMSGRLLDFRRPGPLNEHLKRVLDFVIKNMANLRAIVCLGCDAHWLVSSCPGGDITASLQVGACEDANLFNRGPALLIGLLRHPARPGPGGWSARRKEWAAVAARINRRIAKSGNS